MSKLYVSANDMTLQSRIALFSYHSKNCQRFIVWDGWQYVLYCSASVIGRWRYFHIVGKKSWNL